MDQAVTPPQVKHRANQRLLQVALNEEHIAQLECAFIELSAQFGHYEIKRVFSRLFQQVRGGVFVISIRSRAQAVDEDIVEAAEAAVHKRLEDAKTWIAGKTLEAETLCQAHGIEPSPKFLAPLKLEVKIIAALQREYLEALTAADHLMGLIEILAINGTISPRRAAQEKSAARAKVRSIPGYVRMIQNGMKKVIDERARLGSIAARQAADQTEPTAQNKEAEGPQGPPAPGRAPAATAGARELEPNPPDPRRQPRRSRQWGLTRRARRTRRAWRSSRPPEARRLTLQFAAAAGRCTSGGRDPASAPAPCSAACRD